MEFGDRFLVDADKVSYRIVGEESVILNLESGDYYGLNAAGTAIWEMIMAGKTLGEIVAKLKLSYNTEESTLRSDVKKLLSDLTKEGLIKKDS